MRRTLIDFKKSFINLFYPHLCAGCGTDIMEDKNLLCIKCVSELPHTNFSAQKGNPVEKIFMGRLEVSAAMSEFYFTKDSIVQHLIHQLKYKGNKDVGLYTGAMIGSSLINNPRFPGIDAIIPLPLNPGKERKRGFNQAAILCTGIAEVLELPVIYGAVTRKRFTETQTHKSRGERWENVEDSFEVLKPNLIAGKHILLVDDIITTGATLEACGSEILRQGASALSIATFGFASK